LESEGEFIAPSHFILFCSINGVNKRNFWRVSGMGATHQANKKLGGDR
jgi:hypothetical protein